MNKKTKNRILRKLYRQRPKRQVQSFSYADIHPYEWGWPDWCMD